MVDYICGRYNSLWGRVLLFKPIPEVAFILVAGK